MNNIFEVKEYLNTGNPKEKYELWEKQLTNYTRETIHIKKINKTLDTKKLLYHLKGLKYIIFGNLPEKYGGIGIENLEILKNQNKILINKQKDIYNNLFNIVITKKGIKNPLCNCCLMEFSNKNKGWKTTINKETEYFKDKDGIEFIGTNYLHICPICNNLLKLKIQQYGELKMQKFNKNVFLQQSDEYFDYQPIVFKLLM